MAPKWLGAKSPIRSPTSNPRGRVARTGTSAVSILAEFVLEELSKPTWIQTNPLPDLCWWFPEMGLRSGVCPDSRLLEQMAGGALLPRDGQPGSKGPGAAMISRRAAKRVSFSARINLGTIDTTVPVSPKFTNSVACHQNGGCNRCAAANSPMPRSITAFRIRWSASWRPSRTGAGSGFAGTLRTKKLSISYEVCPMETPACSRTMCAGHMEPRGRRPLGG
jgi:hypothetical protein